MIFKTNDTAEEIATQLVQLVKDGLLPEKSERAALGTALTEVFCRAMLQTLPGLSVDGRDILQVIGDINAVGTFPDPRREAMRAEAKREAN